MKSLMKTYIKLCVCTLCAALILAGCGRQELVFDHEKTQFEPMGNAILVELIAPVGTAVDEEIYIFGAFNGLDEKSAVGKLAWQMEKAANSDNKWGIYLFPSDFQDGKTLADGFSFVSKKSGGERDIKGNPVVHHLDAAVGTAYNVWADRWAAYFSGSETIVHNGPVIYVQDESGFAQLTLYMYGDVNDLGGSWPGKSVTGYETINGIELAYFDMGEGNEGLSETLIFSDNGSDQLADFGPVTLSSEPIYLHITADGKVETLNMDGVVGHDGAVVYVLDGMDWGFSTTLYMWGDVNDLNGGWPGMSVTGTQVFGEYTYLYFDMGAANEGLTEHLIFSNEGKNQLSDYDDYKIGEDIYLYISASGVQVIADPENPGEVEWFNPQATPKEPATIDIWFYEATDSLKLLPDSVSGDSIIPLYVYCWGSNEAFGAWPGKQLDGMDEFSILGLPLKHTRIEGFVGDEYNLIINNNAGKQLPDYQVAASESENEYYLKISDTVVTTLSVVPKNSIKR